MSNRVMTSMKSFMSMAMEEVEGNYDILTEILVRLPAKSFFRFKAVSNRWNLILTESYFLERYISRRKGKSWHCDDKRLLAFIEMNPGPAPSSKEFTSTIVLPVDKNIVKNIPKNLGNVIHSSHGFILCGIRGTFHVVNPLNRKSTSLSPPPIPFRELIMALVCEEENAHELVTNFKIIAVPAFDPSMELMLQTYSSKTRKWAVSKMVSEGVMCICSRDVPPLVSNGVVHWYSDSKDIVLYDSSRDHLDENRAQVIRLPKISQHGKDNRLEECFSLTRSTSCNDDDDDVLWFSV